MKKFILAITIAFCSLSLNAQNKQFGQITITPYIVDMTDSHCYKLLETKLQQIVTANNVASGFDNRFLIVPRINVLSESTTSTIPQKTSLKVEFTFCIGDGISGALFKSTHIETTGIGDNHNKALYSAIRKIRDTDPQLQSLIEDAKVRITAYYNNQVPTIISQARNAIALQDYEKAIELLAVVPSLCNRYSEVQELIFKCGESILARNNAAVINNAKAAWSANPTAQGAEEAKQYLSQVVITCVEEEMAVNELIDDIRERMAQVKDMEMELQRVKMESEERIQTEQIRASQQTASSFFSMLPQLAYSIIGWFL